MSVIKIFTFNDRKEVIYFTVSFFLWPFGALIGSIKNWSKPWAVNFFWLFCVFFGFTFIIAQEGLVSADSIRYAQLLSVYAHSEMSFRELIRSFFSESSGNLDILHPLITFLVSRFTINPSILLAVFGSIFGYFYSRNIWYLLNRIDENKNFVFILLILTYALLNPIWNINGFRMWTAAQIFLFGLLPFLIEGRLKSLVWVLISVFMHFSFLFPLTIVMLFLIFNNKSAIYLIFFLITSFIKELDLQSVRSLLTFLPDIFQTKVISYTNSDYAELVKLNDQEYNWYIKYAGKVVEWVIYTQVIISYFFCKNFFSKRKDLLTLFCFSLLLYGFANISSLVPSGGRFIYLADTFMFAFFILSFPLFSTIKIYKTITRLMIPFLLLFCIVAIRVGMDYYGLMTIIGNPFVASIMKVNNPLIEIVKNLL